MWLEPYGLVRISSPRDNVDARGRRLCRIGNIGSTATRITAKNGRRKSLETSHRETRLSVRGGFRCLEREPSPGVLSVEIFCSQRAKGCSDVPSAVLHFILASNV